MKISPSTSPYWLQIGHNDKTNAAYGKGFGDFLEKEKAESDMTESNTWIAVNKTDSVIKKPFISEPSYTITDEEAEYFREKYGEKYDEDTVAKLYYELSDKGIISRNDAFRASGVDEIKPLSSYRSITYIGGGDPYGLGKCLYRNYGFVSDKVYVKDVSRTDKNSPYKPLWESFRKAYRRNIDTWEDVLQENIDFERYVKENRKTADYVFQQHCDQVIEGLEKTKDVITRIFGEVTL